MIADPVPTPPAPPADAPPAPAAVEADWDDLLLGSFGPRHWNLGCG